MAVKMTQEMLRARAAAVDAYQEASTEGSYYPLDSWALAAEVYTPCSLQHRIHFSVVPA